MTIHHSIMKSAQGRGIVFAYPDSDQIEAIHQVSGTKVIVAYEDDAEQNDAARNAWDIAQQIADYNSQDGRYRIEQDANDLDFVGMDRNTKDEIARDPSFEDLLVTLQQAGEEADGEEADEDEETGSVVPAVYKARYAAEGHPTHCGDWLAETLNGYCRVIDAETGKGTTDLDRLETIANANDVSPARYGKLGVATNGWQGRYRMTIRNMMTPRVASKGFILIPDGAADGDREITAPDAWRQLHMPKAKKSTAAVAKPDAPSGKKSAKKLAKEAAERGVAAATAAVKSAKAKAAA